MRSARRSMGATMLGLEAVVLGLTSPVMISVASVSTGTALGVGLGLAAACVLAAGMLRHRWAFALGWAIQACAFAVGFVVPMMFFLGAIFTALWAGAYFLGGRIDQERAERAVLEEQWAAEHGEG